MTKKLIVRLSGLIALTGVLIALPAEARAAIAEHASMATNYAEEIAIGAAIILGAIVVDMSSWSLMTDDD